MFENLIKELTSEDLLYIRCKDCLSTYTVNRHEVEQSFPCPFFCSCGGDIKVLGRVVDEAAEREKKAAEAAKEGKFIQVKERAICDGKCTHAVGPLCSCTCCAKYHGTGLVVQVVIKEGKITIKDVDAKAVANAKEWRETKAKLNAIMTEKFPTSMAYDAWRKSRIGTRPSYSYEEYRGFNNAQKEMEKMGNAHLHKRRMTLATALIARLTAQPEKTAVDQQLQLITTV